VAICGHIHDATTCDATTTIAELKSPCPRLCASATGAVSLSEEPRMAAVPPRPGVDGAFLWADSEASQERSRERGRRQKIEEEIADVVIYSLDSRMLRGRPGGGHCNEAGGKCSKNIP